MIDPRIDSLINLSADFEWTQNQTYILYVYAMCTNGSFDFFFLEKTQRNNNDFRYKIDCDTQLHGTIIRHQERKNRLPLFLPVVKNESMWYVVCNALLEPAMAVINNNNKIMQKIIKFIAYFDLWVRPGE